MKVQVCCLLPEIYAQGMRISARKIGKVFIVAVIIALTLSLISVFKVDGIKEEHNLIHIFKRSYGRQLSLESETQVVETINIHRKTNGAVNVEVRDKTDQTNNNGIKTNINKLLRKTVQSDIFISVKTTKSNREERLNLLLKTWIASARNEVGNCMIYSFACTCTVGIFVIN